MQEQELDEARRGGKRERRLSGRRPKHKFGVKHEKAVIFYTINMKAWAAHTHMSENNKNCERGNKHLGYSRAQAANSPREHLPRRRVEETIARHGRRMHGERVETQIRGWDIML